MFVCLSDHISAIESIVDSDKHYSVFPCRSTIDGSAINEQLPRGRSEDENAANGDR